jgi:hypothetical protein
MIGRLWMVKCKWCESKWLWSRSISWRDWGKLRNIAVNLDALLPRFETRTYKICSSIYYFTAVININKRESNKCILSYDYIIPSCNHFFLLSYDQVFTYLVTFLLSTSATLCFSESTKQYKIVSKYFTYVPAPLTFWKPQKMITGPELDTVYGNL